MDFELSQDHRVLRDSVRDFVKNEIAPKAMQIDTDHAIPSEITDQLGALGFLGITIPEEFGGAGMDVLSYILLVEEVSKACASTGVVISAHVSLCCDPIMNFGTVEQKKRWLAPLAAGEKIGAFLLTEPDAGSDVANLATRYEETDTGYRITGSKIFITNGGYQGTGVVFATKDKNLRHKGISAFIVDLSAPGVSILKNEDKMGIRGSFTTAFALDDVEVGKDQLLGEEGDGFKIAMDTLNGGRIGIAAQALGIGQGAFDLSVAYAGQRVQFGKPISTLQAIQFKIADMAARLETARLVTYKAAWLKDEGKTNAMESAMAKMIASETATFVTKEAVQVHGGYGFITDYEVERMYRDAKITEIYEGTNEVQRLVIGRMILK